MRCADPKKRVLIADDHRVWRRGLRDILEPFFEVAAEATQGEEAVALALAIAPDAVVMDIRMPGMDGIEAVHRIKEQLPNTAVLMLSVADADADIYGALRAGADGYLLKHCTAETIVVAVEHAVAGRAYLPPEIANRVLNTVGQSGVRPSHLGTPWRSLTTRETEALRYVTQGCTNKEIGRRMSISARTVGKHLANIYAKLGIGDRLDATLYAVKFGIVHVQRQ